VFVGICLPVGTSPCKAAAGLDERCQCVWGGCEQLSSDEPYGPRLERHILMHYLREAQDLSGITRYLVWGKGEVVH